MLGTAGALLAACAHGAAVGERIELAGTLRVRGNVPFAHAVLVTPAGKSWDLNGPVAEQSRGLNDRPVRVRGVVTRPPAPGNWGAALEVEAIEAQRSPGK